MFTINNPLPSDDPEAWNQDLRITFCVWQLEKGEKDSVPHYQGYICFNQTMRLAAMKKINERAHWEGRIAKTHGAAIDYVTKADTRVEGPWFYGDQPQDRGGKGGAGEAGDKRKLEDLKVLIDEGASLTDLYEKSFALVLRNERGLKSYMALKTVRNRDWITFTTVYWGPPGTGKTKRAKYMAGPDAYWLKKPGTHQTVFFDGYDGQEDVVIDEFYGWLPHDLLQRMCDRYPLLVDTKGGAVSFKPRRIWITSNKAPWEWYKKGLGAMERRLEGDFGTIVEMGGPDVWQSLEEIEAAKPRDVERPPLLLDDDEIEQAIKALADQAMEDRCDAQSQLANHALSGWYEHAGGQKDMEKHIAVYNAARDEEDDAYDWYVKHCLKTDSCLDGSDLYEEVKRNGTAALRATMGPVHPDGIQRGAGQLIFQKTEKNTHVVESPRTRMETEERVYNSDDDIGWYEGQLSDSV